MVRTAVLVSGGGTNLQAILDALKCGKIKNCDLAAVISSAPDAYALERARLAGVPGYTVPKSEYRGRARYTAAILAKLRELDIELVVLAGFMFVLGPELVRAYPNRIINVHPALIPSFCGEGFYGLRVHERALEYGVKVTGATVHFASEDADAGPVILQRAVEVQEGDTPEALQKRVMEQAEWQIMPEAISLYCQGRLRVEGRIVHIL